jgi:hypothetical protein
VVIDTIVNENNIFISNTKSSVKLCHLLALENNDKTKNAKREKLG